MVQYVRGNFFAGEEFVDLADAQARAQAWCADKAGQRIHGTTCAQPAVVFAEREAAALLPAPTAGYQVPIYAQVKVHRDYHIQIGQALYSIPEHLRGQTISVRADGELVKMYYRGTAGQNPSPPTCRRAIHRPGGSARRQDRLRHAGSDPADRHRRRPWGRTSASTPNACSITSCRGPGCARCIGCWGWSNATARPRSNTACGRALELDVVSVTKIAAMLQKATENTPAEPPRAATGLAPARFARDPGEYRTHPIQPPAGLDDRHRRRRHHRRPQPASRGCGDQWLPNLLLATRSRLTSSV